MSNKSRTDCYHRRKQILGALAVSPLTAEQICALSATFLDPLKQPAYVKKLMARIRDVGDILEFTYPDGTKYWRLSKAGYKTLNGDDYKVPQKRALYQPLSRSLWYHCRRLAAVLVKLQVSAHSHGIDVLELYGDKQILLRQGERKKLPDGKIALKLKLNGKKSYHHVFIELDCGTEWGYQSEVDDSLNNLIQFYLDHHAASEQPYRVLMLFDKPSRRVHHFLNRVKELNRQPNQRIIKAAVVDQLLQHENPLQSPYLLDWDQQLTSLLPSKHPAGQQIPLPKLDLASAAC